MLEFSELSLPVIVLLFAGAAAVVGFFGVKLAGEADELADVTGLGEALMGGIFLGALTSLSGTVTSVTAAWNGQADLAFSNAIGGIAAQTVFLAVADVAYRRANLEHAASSLPNLLQGALLVCLLTLPLIAMAGPEWSLGGVHVVSWLLIPAYVMGMRLVSNVQKQPLWQPEQTAETRLDEVKPPVESSGGATDLTRRWLKFAGLGCVVGVAGYVIAKTGGEISARTEVSATLVGMLFTSVSTSLPELITSIAAVRRGALTLAVGGIIGGNCFDVLFLTFSDVAYRGGSIYHAVGFEQVYVLAMCLLVTGILLMGLLRREKHGIANIGFESVLILTVYVLGLAGLIMRG